MIFCGNYFTRIICKAYKTEAFLLAQRQALVEVGDEMGRRRRRASIAHYEYMAAAIEGVDEQREERVKFIARYEVERALEFFEIGVDLGSELSLHFVFLS